MRSRGCHTRAARINAIPSTPGRRRPRIDDASRPTEPVASEFVSPATTFLPVSTDLVVGPDATLQNPPFRPPAAGASETLLAAS